MIEVVSPGNKDSKHAIASFVAKAVEFIRNGIDFLVIDPFPPGPREPEGIAQAIWNELVGEPLANRTAEKSLVVAAYDAGEPLTAYVDSLAIADPLPDSPLFLAPGWYVNVPLEQTYQASWAVTPKPIRDLVALPARDVNAVTASAHPAGNAERDRKGQDRIIDHSRISERGRPFSVAFSPSLISRRVGNPVTPRVAEQPVLPSREHLHDGPCRSG